MKKAFTTTYIALLVNEDNNNVVKFSDFKSVEDFKKFLQDNHLTYDAGEGNFISTNDDGYTSHIYICEKGYYEEMGDIADWDHKGLSNYLYDHGDESLTWGEDYESAWYVLGDYDSTVDETLEKIFNDLKLIDDVEIEIEFPEDYEFGYEAKYYTPAVKNNNMKTIRTVKDLRELIEQLDDDFVIDFRVRRKLSEEELKNMRYPYPYETEYFEGIEFDDIGYSDKEICLGVTFNE